MNEQEKNITDYKFAVIGHPIDHSLSPIMHQKWLECAGYHGTYEKLDIAENELGRFLTTVRMGGWSGFNVTIPHKETIIPYLDKLAPQARRIGAVNTVKVEGEKLIGFNTDGLGFLAPLREKKFDFRQPVLLIGAGGAARAILVALLLTDVPLVMVLNRSQERAKNLVATIGSGRASVVDWENKGDAVAAAGLIINSTSLGMIGNDQLDINMEGAARGCVIYDIVYRPLETRFLRDAKNRGLGCYDGLDMLIHQGAASFKIWTGVAPEISDTRQLLLTALGEDA